MTQTKDLSVAYPAVLSSRAAVHTEESQGSVLYQCFTEFPDLHTILPVKFHNAMALTGLTAIT